MSAQQTRTGARLTSDGDAGAIRLRFTGSASEYFRLCIVNALLVLLTLGVLLPWAQRRTTRYFVTHTEAGDQEAGYQLIEYRGASVQGSCAVILASLVILGLLSWRSDGQPGSPAGLTVLILLLAGWRLRRAQVCRDTLYWRGMPIRYCGQGFSLWRACFPSMFVTLIGGVAAWSLAESTIDSPSTTIVMLACLVFSIGLLALWNLRWRVCRQLMSGLAVGRVVFALSMPDSRFRRLQLQAVVIGTATLAGAVFWYIGVEALTFALFGDGRKLLGARIFTVGLAFFMPMMAWQCALAPWLQARRQNLLWSDMVSGDGQWRLTSQLESRRYAYCSARGWVLTLLSAGVYRPLAVHALMRMRIEAVSVRHWDRPQTLNNAPWLLSSPHAVASPSVPDCREHWLLRLSRLHGMEFVLPLALATAVWLSAIWTLPVVERALVAQLPGALDRWPLSLGAAEGAALAPTQLGEDEQARVSALLEEFVQRVWPEGKAPGHRLQFVRTGDKSGPARIRPDGLLYLSDELITLTRRIGQEEGIDPDRILTGIFAHELAHLEQRGPSHALVRALILVAVTRQLLGDVAVLPSLWVILMSSPRHSPLDSFTLERERDADRRSAEYMRTAGLSPCVMAKFYAALDREAGIAMKAPTHPSHAERAAMFGPDCSRQAGVS